MKLYKVKIEGKTPLMHHRMPESELFALLGTKTKRKKDKDDGEQTPRDIAQKHVYQNDDGTFYVPSEYLTGAIANVAGDYKQKNSIRKSLKAIIKGVVQPQEIKATLTDKKGKELTDFEVDIRKATNHQKGAVAVCRPRFDEWAFEIELSIDDSLISPQTCLEIINDAGKRSGMGSYRVQRGGIFGQFQVTNWEQVE